MTRALVVACVLALAASANSVFAQVQRQPHGTPVQVTKNDKTVLDGIVVWDDANKNVLYVRTQPGTRPVALNRGQIAKVTSKGKAQPELHRIVIHNGAMTSTSYLGSTLSADEKAALAQLQQAEGEYQRVQSLIAAKAGVLASELAIQWERRRANEIIGQILQRQYWQLGNIQQNGVYLGQVPLAYRYPLFPNYIGVSGNTSHVLSISGSDPNLLKAMMPGPQDQADLEKAREAMTKAQSRLIYEDGQVIGVLP